MKTTEEKRKYKRQWDSTHKEKKKADAHAWYLRNRAVTIERGKASSLKRKYGMTVADRDQMYAKQKGLCGICHLLIIGTPHVDHDHITGKVRALTHGPCNRKLGVLEDPVFVAQGNTYLNYHKERVTNEAQEDHKVIPFPAKHRGTQAPPHPRTSHPTVCNGKLRGHQISG